jgi:ketosteroid isomerase-like protein
VLGRAHLAVRERVRVRAIGKRSGAEVDMKTFSLWTLRDGKLVRWQGYPSEEEAHEAATAPN